MSSPDPWLVLGLAPGSSVAQARAARRRLAKQLHPDLHPGQTQLSAQMAAVNRALAEIEAIPASPPVPEAGSSAAALFDPDSFSVEWLPAEAFEALFLVAYALGDILVAEEPYLLEVYLSEPFPCFCRLTLMPEAGGSLVTVEVSGAAESHEAPDTNDVIAVLVAELNGLVSSQP